MSIGKAQLVAALSPRVQADILDRLIAEYTDIKQQFLLRRFRPSELNGGRFAEAVVRLLQYVDTTTYTPFGTQVNSESVLNHIASNTALGDTIRLFVPKQTRILFDVRNRRDVAHVGGDVCPNYSDALFVSACADWIMVELVRHFRGGTMDEARAIVQSICEIRMPVVAEVNGFVRVQNTRLDAPQRTLVVLYHKDPEPVGDSTLCEWIRYANLSRYRRQILPALDAEALIHYHEGECRLLPKGTLRVEQTIPLDLLI